MPRGVYLRTEEARRNIGIASKDRKHSEEAKQKMSESSKGQKPWNKGKIGGKISEDHKRKIGEANKGAKSSSWKGGRTKNSQGYILIQKPNHPFCNNQGYIRESRFIMEQSLGRYLTPEEVVHHRGIKYPLRSIENRSDNRIKNLKLFANKKEHIKYHWEIRKTHKVRR